MRKITLTIAWLLLQCILELLPEKYPTRQYNFYRYSKACKRKKKYPVPFNVLIFYVLLLKNTHSKKRPWIHPFMAAIFQKRLKNMAVLYVRKKSCLSFWYERIFETLISYCVKTMYHKVANMHASCLVAPHKDFQTAYEGVIWCLFIVTFWGKSWFLQ